MSGVAGLAMLDGSAAADDALARIMAATAHRDVHGGRDVAAGPIAFGHQLLDVAGDEPPMSGMAESDGCIVTADCRLDNREELLAELGADESAGDAELILAAYRRWGADAPARLLGDFAFALWDPAQGRLLCALDHFGVRPLYYAVAGGAFVFSSEPCGVLASGWVDATINEDALCAYLAGVAPNVDETFNAQVKRLPAAHVLILEGARLEVRPYWRLQPIEVGDEDAAAGLRRRLELAVAARLRGASRAGAMLSGGLDSSTIAGLAAPLHRRTTGEPLKTFSLVFDETPAWNERPQIEAVLATIDAAPRFLPSNGLSYVDRLPALLREQNSPFVAPNLPASRTIYEAARHDEVRVLLDGHGGDEVISVGTQWLAELAAGGRWIELWRQLSALGRNEGFSARPVFWSLLKRRARIARLLRPLRALRKAPPPATRSPGASRFLQPGYAERVEVLERAARKMFGGPDRTEQQRHLAIVTGPLQPYALEILDKAAAAAGVEARYPLWDKRVVEFCCSVAPAEKLKGGRTRSLIRRAMADVLPEQVRNRPDKFDFMPHLRAGFAGPSSPAPEAVFPEAKRGLGEILRLTELRSAYQRLQDNPESCTALEVQALWRCAALALWWQEQRKYSPELLMSPKALA